MEAMPSQQANISTSDSSWIPNFNAYINYFKLEAYKYNQLLLNMKI